MRRNSTPASVPSVLAILLLAVLPARTEAQETPSPSDVLGHELGERFTTPAGVVSYMDRLAAASPRVGLHRYGRTPEGRPLVHVVVSARRNLERLDDILERNARLTDPDLPAEEAAEIARDNPAVVWLGYGVHGDESSSTEAALWTAHDLATAEGDLTTVLDSVVVLLDPMLNPDGRARYVSWYRGARGETPNPRPGTREHRPPWPSGRYNHYLYDLNRDWAWATQAETRARLRQWDRWNPQVHVDFHEMSPRSSYFFFPATRPLNPFYPDYIFRWGEYFGRRNAGAFDRRGWLYYTRESFDLFYPGYGDSWPSLLGAIGMTFEQAGGGRAGLAYRRPDGSVLTLRERATHHRVSGRTTLAAVAERKTALLMDFAAFHRAEGEELPDVLLVPERREEATRAMADLLRVQGIRVLRAGSPFRADAGPYPGYEERREFPVGTLVVPGRQPRALLAATLLQPDVPFDSAGTKFTYDITGWSLPYAYGVEAHLVDELDVSGLRGLSETEAASGGGSAGGRRSGRPRPAYGYLVEPSQEAVGPVIRYLEDGGRVRAMEEPVEIAGRSWPRGTYFLPGDSAAPRRIEESGLGPLVAPVSSGRTASGPDLGTERALDLRAPRIGVVMGEGIDASSYGFTWFFLERMTRVPFDALPADGVDGERLADYDVVVLPDGRPGRALGEPSRDALLAWVRAGGTLVAYEGSARWAAETLDDVSVRPDTAAMTDGDSAAAGLRTREERREDRWERRITGIVLPVRLDPDHPLAWGADAAGEPGRLFALHRESLIFEPDPSYETVAYFDRDVTAVSGVVSDRALDELRGAGWLAAVREGRGRAILFADDPLYRLFWHSTFQLFANAILLGPAM